MSYRVDAAVAAWNDEVDTEMVRLIEQGVPPFDAAGMAREIVTSRRQRTARERRAEERSPNGR